MKKSTKKIIISIVIILVLGMSSIAFVATGLLGNTQQQQQSQQLTSPIVKGEVDAATETAYIQNGFTWVKYYYTEKDPSFTFFIESLPQAYPTASGQPQIIVQELNEQYSNETNYVTITSLAGQESFSADPTKIVSSLCNLLTITPFECLINTNNNTI